MATWRNDEKTGETFECVKLTEEQVEKKGDAFVLKDSPTFGSMPGPTRCPRAAATSSIPTTSSSEYGADSLRLYEMFMGPLEAVKPWNMRGVEGVYRFLGRVWRLFVDDRADDDAAVRRGAATCRRTARRCGMLHRTIQRVTEDLDGMRFNTAIAAMMEFTNHLTPLSVRPRSVLEPFVLLLAPFAPHLAEELWQALGHRDTLAYEPWPTFDPALTQGRRDRGAGAGQRQGASASDGAGRDRQGGAGENGPGRRARAAVDRGQAGAQGHRRAGEAGEHRRWRMNVSEQACLF